LKIPRAFDPEHVLDDIHANVPGGSVSDTPGGSPVGRTRRGGKRSAAANRQSETEFSRHVETLMMETRAIVRDFLP
jgi:hypothetical protein